MAYCVIACKTITAAKPPPDAHSFRQFARFH